ncbi:MAG: hypothetical protein ABEH43_07130, partial [Flavobacteriales bacterium]
NRTHIFRGKTDWMILGGKFATDPNKSTGEQAWEVASRFTWQLPQTMVGFGFAQVVNMTGAYGGLDGTIDHKYGATVLETKNDRWGGVTLGNYIIGDADIEADADNPLFQHEYGHYIQSQKMGPAYFSRIGIPSALSEGDHDLHPVEQDANRRAFLYFNKNLSDFKDDDDKTANTFDGNEGWDFDYNPLNVEGEGGKYINYNNENDVRSLQQLRVHSRWYDYAGGAMSSAPTLITIGLYNAGKYNGLW